MKALDLNYLVKAPPGIIFVPFLREHAYRMNIEQSDVAAFASADLGEILDYQARKGLAITVLERGKPIGVWGAVEIWSGVQEAWFMLEEATRRYAIAMTKTAKKFIDLKFQDDSLHRLQITVRCDDNRAVKWAECLGFQTEGVMKKYGPDGADFYIMSITKEN